MNPNNQKNGFQAHLAKINLDLAAYTIQLDFKNRKEPLEIHFDKPARRFYFSLIVLLIVEMKNQGRAEFISIRKFEKTLKQLDASLAGSNASKTVEGMWDKIRKAWRYTLPDLEAGGLFKILNRSQIPPYEKGGKYRYDCSEIECDVWANLFDYDENNPWRLKFAIDSVSLSLDAISLSLGELCDNAAWQEFLGGLSGQSEETASEESPPSKWRKKVVLSLAALMFVAAAASLLWKPYRSSEPQTAGIDMSGKLSIAVLPFDNMSNDPEQDYFCDGFTDDLITDLSKISELFVIARNSSFTYKGQPTKIQQIAKELGVRYVLEGSVRRAGEQIRINAQLVDGKSGHHLWAGRYDRDAEGFFEMQDGLSKEILTALKVELTMGEQVRLFARNTDNFQAYLTFLQAAYQQRKTHQEGNIKARKLCRQAINMDPEYADPYRLLAWTHLWDVWFGWSRSPEKSFKTAEGYAEQALSLDELNPNTIALMGHISLMNRQHEKAIALGERSIALSPNSANNYMIMAGTLRFSGKAAEGIPLLHTAIRLEPHTPANYFYQLGMAYNFTGQYDDAITVLQKALKRTPDHLLSLLGLTIAYSLADRMQEAQAAAVELLKVNPKLSVAYLEKKAPYKYKADLEHSMNALRKAGLK